MALTDQFLGDICEKYELNRKNLRVTFKNNSSYLFSTKHASGLKKEIKRLYGEYINYTLQKKSSTSKDFESFLLENWINDKTYTGKRKRMKKIGISVERCIYESPEINRFKNFLTAKEQKVYKSEIKDKIKNVYK